MLENMVALVTGASRGIGKEIALTLGREKATVIVNYNGSKERAIKVTDEIISQGGKAEIARFDVSSYEESEGAIKDIISKFGKIDILVNNAGITKDNLIMKMKEEDFDKVIDINLKGTFNCIKHVSRQMIKQRSGKIINISSVSGVLGNAGQVNYSASKAGVIGLTKSVARELAPRGINVNAVAPGFIQTEMTDSLSQDIKESVTTQIPLKRFGATKEIAEVVGFLASNNANYITGQVIHVDGGMAM